MLMSQMTWKFKSSREEISEKWNIAVLTIWYEIKSAISLMASMISRSNGHSHSLWRFTVTDSWYRFGSEWNFHPVSLIRH